LTVVASDAGKTFCNVGASGAVTFTLPAAANCTPGDDFLFLSCADQNFAVAAANAGELITFNDVAANSVTLSTSSEKAGGAVLVTCVSGSKFHVALMTEETQTVTVAT
jgi:hypothetical protein